MKRAALSVVPSDPSRRKVVEFSEETALRFIRKAYPQAEITVAREDRYQGDKAGVFYEVTVNEPGRYLKGKSRSSLRDAFRDLIQSEKIVMG